MKSFECDLYLDLMPLVKDGAVSDTSRKALEEHIASCESCRSIYESMPSAPGGTERAEITLKKLRRRLLIGVLVVMIVAAMAGIGMTNTTSIVYNSVIFPLVGVLAFAFLKRWSWTVPLGVLFLSVSFLNAKYAVMDGLSFGQAYSDAIRWGLCYSLTCCVGVGLGALGYYCVSPAEKKGWKYRLERIGAALLIGVLSYGGLFCFYMFLGNPFVTESVRLDAEAYIEEEYPGNDFELGDPRYNFLEGSYHVRVESESSGDTIFDLLYDRWGNFQDDGYDLSVGSGNQTMARLIREYEDTVQQRIAILEDMDYVIAELSVLDVRTGVSAPLAVGIDPGTLEVDGQYDVKALGTTYGYVSIDAWDEEVTFDRAAELLRTALEALEKEDVGVYAFRIQLTGEGEETLLVEMVRPEDIKSQDPAARLEEIWNMQQE